MKFMAEPFFIVWWFPPSYPQAEDHSLYFADFWLLVLL